MSTRLRCLTQCAEVGTLIKLDMLGEGGVAAACSMWEWGCKRDAGRREGHRRDVAKGRDMA